MYCVTHGYSRCFSLLASPPPPSVRQLVRHPPTLCTILVFGFFCTLLPRVAERFRQLLFRTAGQKKLHPRYRALQLAETCRWPAHLSPRRNCSYVMCINAYRLLAPCSEVLLPSLVFCLE